MTRVALLMGLVIYAGVAFAQPRPDTFVDAATVVPNLVVDMQYFGAANFVGKRIDGYEGPVCLLTREAATALAKAARELEPQGLALKAFDCYRPVRAVRHFVRWARDIADIARKAEHYPQVDKRTLFRDGYIAGRSGHSRGSTIDLTLVRRKDGAELDMGTRFDFFGPQAAPSYRGISPAAQANRATLARAMRNAGFSPYSKEWWHFTLRNEPYPDRYFDFPVR